MSRARKVIDPSQCCRPPVRGIPDLPEARVTRGEITVLLEQARTGDDRALAELIPLVYAELRRLAAYYLGRERRGHTLQATELVHEAYLRLVGQKGRTYRNRAHFFAVAAKVMRLLLVDYARGHRAAKRGCGKLLPLEEALALPAPESENLLEFHQALDRLAMNDPRAAQLVEVRYFCGLSNEETAEVMGICTRTAQREWRMAKAWLHGELRPGGKTPPTGEP